MQSLLMQYLIFGNNFTGTPSEHFQADECGKHPICENKISLNPQNTCSFMLVFTVSLLKRLRAVYFISKRMIKEANTKQNKNQRAQNGKTSFPGSLFFQRGPGNEYFPFLALVPSHFFLLSFSVPRSIAGT